ncbi:MAG: DNA repair protein RadC [candidate division WOR-3 bacterium]|nr:MAG: DNA repair protein RadC [candidate division WOR-3 bacterium]
MKIKDWPASDRPREKFYERGSYGLTDTELLAIIIGKGARNRTAVDLAKEIFNKTGSLKKLSQKTVGEIERLKITGLGRAKIISILAALEAGRRSLSSRGRKRVKFANPDDVFKFYAPLIGGLKFEVFKVAAVDGRNILINDHTVSKGILDASLVHPREVFQFAINESASAIFLIHNHPSGIQKPSEDDLKITERIRRAGDIVGVSVVDHVIISEDGYYSFSQHHLL